MSSIKAIYSYDFHSESARRLAGELGVRIIRHEGSTFKGNADKLVLNWGSSDLPVQVRRSTVLNTENAVHDAIHKVRAFNKMSERGVRTVPYTTDRATAILWLTEGHRVFARTKVSGKDGEGLIECFINDQIPEARLYTKFVKAEKEYRIMVGATNDPEMHDPVVISRQRKVRLDDHDGPFNDDIKTSSNGYGFKWVTQNIPREVEREACKAVRQLELDFGGVDVIWDGRQAYVLEVNTAPELTPKSAEAFANYLNREYPSE